MCIDDAMKIELPQGVKAEVNGSEVKVSGSLGQNARKFNGVLLAVKTDNGIVEVTAIAKGALAKKAAKALNAFANELRNDVSGVAKHFEKQMSIVFAHFPMTVEAKGSEVLIKNMFGERSVRKARIVGDTKVEVKGQNVRIYGTSLDDVAQTAANIRSATKIRKRDIRVFQDGIYYAIKE